MKRIILLLCFLLVLLAGCREEPVRETNPDGTPVRYDRDDLAESPFFGIIPPQQATFFLGELPKVNEPLNVVDMARRNDGCVYQGKPYKKIVFPPYLTVDDCFWQLDCNYLHVLGENSRGEIVYAIGDPVETLLIVNAENEPEWYVDNTHDILNPCAYSFDDFDVETIYGLSVRPNSISEIWEYHTGKEYDSVRYFIMDHLDFQRYFLRCKDRPWLVYELRCTYTYDGFLYIYNIPNDGMLLMNE